MRTMIGWITALAISASPCAWDTHAPEQAQAAAALAALSTAAGKPAPSAGLPAP
ncbi:hypothetical protein HWE04_07025 [Herbaspirillum sp. C7C2]|uniref:hypothetical protein n=1 Tax=Herbaspirillum sp. C7C2 TaxID=2736666 RepID=UPI001F52A780|nr:hypothetical protein [Herbaspirillum sp. C7C2]MCI1013597.1 hypothetical protein [Herbaspirillum sp. C7C2]